MKATLLFLSAILLCGAALAADETKAPAAGHAADLGTGIVARINGRDLPYEWFLHEFRSSFFRQGGGGVRQKVFDEFLERMEMFEIAVRSGVAEEPEVQARIRGKIDNMRAYQAYQLAMMEKSMVIEAYLAKQGLGPEQFGATEDEVKEFFDREIAGKPGAPMSYKLIPAEVRPQIEERIRKLKQERAVRDLIAREREWMTIEVNQALVDSVPLPQMTGNVPAEFK